MAATEVLAPGTTAATSSDIAVTATPVQLIAKGPAGAALTTSTFGLSVEVKTSNSTWLSYTRFNPDDGAGVMVLRYPGIYRVKRNAQSASIGVDQT